MTKNLWQTERQKGGTWKNTVAMNLINLKKFRTLFSIQRNLRLGQWVPGLTSLSYPLRSFQCIMCHWTVESEGRGQSETFSVISGYGDQLYTRVLRPPSFQRSLHLPVESLWSAALYQHSANDSRHRTSAVWPRQCPQHPGTYVYLPWSSYITTYKYNLDSANLRQGV